MAIYYYELFLDETGSFSAIQKGEDNQYTDVEKSANVGFLVKTEAKEDSGSFSDFFSHSKRQIVFNEKLKTVSDFVNKVFVTLCRRSFDVLTEPGVISQADRNKLMNPDPAHGDYCFKAITAADKIRKLYPVVIDHWGATLSQPKNSLSFKARSFIQPRYLVAMIDCLNQNFENRWQIVAFHSKQRAQLANFEKLENAKAIKALYYVDSLIDGVVQLWLDLYKQHELKQEVFYLNVFIANKTVNGALLKTTDYLNTDKKYSKLLMQIIDDPNVNINSIKEKLQNSLKMQIFGGFTTPEDNEAKRRAYSKAYSEILKGENFYGDEAFDKHILLTVADNFANAYSHYAKEKDDAATVKRAKTTYRDIFNSKLIEQDKFALYKTNFNFYVAYTTALKRGQKLSYVYDPKIHILFWDNGDDFETWKSAYDQKLKANFHEILKPLANENYRNEFINTTVLYLKDVLPSNKDLKHLHIVENLQSIYLKIADNCRKEKGYLPKRVAVFGLDLVLFKVYLYQNLGKTGEAESLLAASKDDVIKLANSMAYVDRHTIFTELKMNGMLDKFRNDLLENAYRDMEERLKSLKWLSESYIATITGQELPRKKPSLIFTKDLGKIHNMFIESQITRAIRNHYNKKSTGDTFERDLESYNYYKKIYMASLSCLSDYKERDFTYSNFLRLTLMYPKKINVSEQILMASLSKDLSDLAVAGRGNWSVNDYFKKNENRHLKFEVLVKNGLYDENEKLRLYVLLNYLSVLRKLVIIGNESEYNKLMEGLKFANIMLDEQRLQNHYPLCIIYWRIAEIILESDEDANFDNILRAIHLVNGNKRFGKRIEVGVELINKSIAHLESMGADDITNLRVMAIKIAVLAYKVHYINSIKKIYSEVYVDKTDFNLTITALVNLYERFSKQTIVHEVENKDATINLFAPVIARCKINKSFDKMALIKNSKYLAQCVPDYF